MSWKRKKLERLFDELTAFALLNRLDGGPSDLTQNDPRACAVREKRQLELLAEIARLDSRHDFVGWMTPHAGTSVPSPSGGSRAA
jgi:hypothetical protein